MNKNEQFVITINRELGSGGRTIGRKLAEKLGVEYHDKALINALDEKYNLSTEEIEAIKGRSNHWWDDFKRVVGISSSLERGSEKDSIIDIPDLLTTDELFRAERKIMKELAESGSSVIAGRSAFFLLSDHPNHISILIQAPREYRIQRVSQKQGLSAGEAEKVIDKVDQMRENYVKQYAGTSRYDTRNYDLVFTMGEGKEDQIVDMILQYIG